MLTAEHFNVIFTAEQIQARVKELGAQISRDYEGSYPILIAMLKGSVFFLSDLSRAITIPHHFDFLGIYGDQASSQDAGILRIERDVKFDLEGRDIIVIEEILRTGLTTNYMLQILEDRNPRSVNLCTLLVNPNQLLLDLPVTYQGFEIDERRVVGYGMDIKEKGRQLPFIAEYTLGLFKNLEQSREV